MKPAFDLDALRTLVTGTDLGSFARAAVQLGRSQSAVSMQLKKLEEQAGQPLLRRSGRGLVPTEAGDALLAYARRILDLHDEAAASLGLLSTAATLRMGLPQDFFEDVMPETLTRFARLRPGLPIEVRAGRNHALAEEVRAGRLDLAIAFCPSGADMPGERLVSLPMRWLGGTALADERVPLVLFDHPCLFRQAALQALDAHRRGWRLALTTPSLPGIWAALRFGHGITVRTPYRVPEDIRDAGAELSLPGLPSLDLRLIAAADPSPAARDLREVLTAVAHEQIVGFQ